MRDSAASAPTDRLFQSVLQPVTTPSPTVTATRRVPGLRVTPTVTPGVLAPALVAARRLLPLVTKGWPPTPTFTPTPTQTYTPTPTPIGWKGISHPNAANKVVTAMPGNGFQGINPSWWYDWGQTATTPVAAAANSVAETLALLEAGLKDPGYVPMIWGPADAGGGISPQAAAALAAAHPGRVWLIFNEPDNDSGDAAGCGDVIKATATAEGRVYYPAAQWVGTPWPFDPQPTATPAPGVPAPTPDPLGYNQLGKYLAGQYRDYYCAIKAADPTARVFSPGLLVLPLPNRTYSPGSSTDWKGYKRGLAIWDKFRLYLADPIAVPNCPNGSRPGLDGIAVHSYTGNFSTYHAGCAANARDIECLKRALPDAYGFFQAHPLTRDKPIWITEVGSLAALQQQSHTDTANFMGELMRYARANFTPAGSLKWCNALAWYTTYDATWKATNLLNSPDSTLTAVGVRWKVETCPNCECPGPGCP